RALLVLFFGFVRLPKVQERIFSALLDLCREARLVSEMDVNQATLTGYFEVRISTGLGRRSILRKLHAALIADNSRPGCSEVMIALLGLYTESDAESAIEDAQECVRTAVVDPKSFSFDHNSIARLSAVRQLEKDPAMHKALQLFATGTDKWGLPVLRHHTFVTEKLRVEDAILVKKMRLLTL
ncbi:hypothetical protein PFISCL1PPCAC_7374, partial [Pristionchus fissidentatus]